jgi:hypothetical protein
MSHFVFSAVNATLLLRMVGTVLLGALRGRGGLSCGENAFSKEGLL